MVTYFKKPLPTSHFPKITERQTKFAGLWPTGQTAFRFSPTTPDSDRLFNTKHSRLPYAPVHLGPVRQEKYEERPTVQRQSANRFRYSGKKTGRPRELCKGDITLATTPRARHHTASNPLAPTLFMAACCAPWAADRFNLPNSSLTNEKPVNSDWLMAIMTAGSVGVRVGFSDVKSLSKLLVSVRDFWKEKENRRLYFYVSEY